ncbi:MAG: transcription elongation factor GreA [Candidatus Paceibacterota bacterium]
MTKRILTKEGLEKLQQELDMLKTVERQKVAQRIQTSKELGDLSENAEYSEAKEQQALNESRVAEIEDIIKNSEVIDGSKTGSGKVFVGSTITVNNGKEDRVYTIVGSNEADPLIGKISNESPMAMSFMGRKIGEKVSVSTPKGEIEYEIREIK